MSPIQHAVYHAWPGGGGEDDQHPFRLFLPAYLSPFYYCRDLQIRVLGIPNSGAKSRVETQIKLCIQLVTDRGDKVPLWSHLKLPEHLVAKEKYKRVNQQKIDSGAAANVPLNDAKLLTLEATVKCFSDPLRKVETCLGCVRREVRAVLLSIGSFGPWFRNFASNSIYLTVLVISPNSEGAPNAKRKISRNGIFRRAYLPHLHPLLVKTPPLQMIVTMCRLWKNAEFFCSTVPRSWISVLVTVFFLPELPVIVAITMKKLDFGKWPIDSLYQFGHIIIPVY